MEPATEFCRKCYKCVHRGDVPGSAHSQCTKKPTPTVEGNPHGIKEGWFYFPFNFDPACLQKCDSFKAK